MPPPPPYGCSTQGVQGGGAGRGSAQGLAACQGRTLQLCSALVAGWLLVPRALVVWACCCATRRLRTCAPCLFTPLNSHTQTHRRSSLQPQDGRLATAALPAHLLHVALTLRTCASASAGLPPAPAPPARPAWTGQRAPQPPVLTCAQPPPPSCRPGRRGGVARTLRPTAVATPGRAAPCAVPTPAGKPVQGAAG